MTIHRNRLNNIGLGIVALVMVVTAGYQENLSKTLDTPVCMPHTYINDNIPKKNKSLNVPKKKISKDKVRKNFLSSSRGTRELSRVMTAIASAESGRNYKSQSEWSSASGAYQYIDSTWNNYGGYKRAYLAPKWVQDKRMLHELVVNYKRYGRWDKVIAHHFLPSRADKMYTWDDPVNGNPTVREYVDVVLRKAGMKDRYE